MKLLLSLLLLPFIAFSQQADEEAVIKVIQVLFDGMRAGDSSMVSSAFHPEARMQTTFTDREGNPTVRSQEVSGFLAAIGRPHDEVWDEKIWSYDVHLEDNLATAWTEYTFFAGERMSHCGVNAFQLFKDKEGWKIIQVTDTRRRENCQTEPSDVAVVIGDLLDQWHAAAATADEDTFFGSMTVDAIYLGTDATEKWKRDELKEWSKKYFEKESAWSFKATDREVYLSKNETYAWFDELLDTWMGTCRGSGVLQKFPEGWKLMHYNLAVMVPNEKMNEVIELMKSDKK